VPTSVLMSQIRGVDYFEELDVLYIFLNNVLIVARLLALKIESALERSNKNSFVPLYEIKAIEAEEEIFQAKIGRCPLNLKSVSAVPFL
jgi:hypothetical protein